MAAEHTRLARHTVEPCPQCGARHDYAIELRQGPLMFGGSADQRVVTTADCPTTGQLFETTITVPASDDFVRIVKPSESGAHSAAATDSAVAAPAQPQGGEYDDWLRASRDRGIDFGKTMLTASSGAVAVYFAVLNYLGSSHAARSVTGALSVAPPVLFLAATAAFALALKPHLAPVPRERFSAFRDERLRHLDRWMQSGLALFIAALVVALVVYARVMNL